MRPGGGFGYRDLFVAAAFAALFLFGLGSPELLDPDESRHAAIALDMLVERNFVTPRVYGEPYYDKPVGFHWLVASSLAAFGPSTFSARLPSSLAALATLATTAWWASRLYGSNAARIATTSLATTYFFLALGRFAGIDMVFATLLTAAIALVSVAVETRASARAGKPATPRRSLWPAYALIGFATLVKGPVAIVLALPALISAGFAGRSGWGWLTPWRGAALVALVPLPWYFAAHAADPAYVRTFLEIHNVGRFMGSEVLAHQRPLVYYLAALPLALMPWTPWFALGAASRIRAGDLRAGERIVIAWIATVLIVFALARTRLVTYLLPAFPAIAVLAAGGLEPILAAVSHRVHGPMARWSRVCGSAIAVACVAAAALSISSAHETMPTLVIAAAAASAALAFLALLWRKRRDAAATPDRAMALLAAGAFVAAIGAYGPVARLLTDAKGYRALAAAVERSLPPDATVASLSRAAHALSFYAQRPVTRVRDLDAARMALAGPGPMLLLTKKAYAEALTSQSPSSTEILWRNAQGTTLVANSGAAIEWRRREGVEPSADREGRHHGFEDRSGHRTRSLSSILARPPP